MTDRSPDSPTTVTVVVPVRDGGALIDACLCTLLPQATNLGGEVIVVDDRSKDDTAWRAAALGARVLIAASPGGPYAARNVGWRATNADVVVFTDARCRAAPGWLAALVQAFEDPTVALAGGDVRVLRGRRLAERAAGRLQPLLAQNGQDHPFLPWLPTANLAARRSVLETENGFTERRGGADVDLCWRVQLDGLGSLRVVPRAMMDWEPRRSVPALLRQYRRYGQNDRRLGDDYAGRGCPQPPRDGLLGDFAAHGRQTLAELWRSPVREWSEVVVTGACRVAYRAGQGSDGLFGGASQGRGARRALAMRVRSRTRDRP